ncbi:MAG: AraC family transcriptional regulator [Phycisphaerae bacterium]|jgi:AraC family transcriptional regulator
MTSPTQRTYHERMLQVLVHIQQHLDEALSLDELAAVAHFSPFHFHRIFRGMLGESVMEHIRRLRLERATQQLKYTDQPITRIAFQAGYETHEAFTRAFRAMFGDAPSRFREIHRPVPLPAAPSGVHYDPAGGPHDFQPTHTGDTPMDVTIKKIDPIRVAFVRHVGPYQEVGQTWQKLCALAGQRGLFGPQSKFLGLCHDDPEVTPPDKIRYDACVVVDERAQPEGELGIQTIPAGDYAVTVHAGPYEGLSRTYAQLCGEAIPQLGREIRSGPSIEVYLNDPNQTAPADLRTEVHIPLEPA